MQWYYQIFLLLVGLVEIVELVDLDEKITPSVIAGIRRMMKITIKKMRHLIFVVFFISSSSSFVHSRQLS